MTVRIRLTRPADAPLFAALLIANREFLAPWDLVREESYYTEAGQRGFIDAALERYRSGAALPYVITIGDRPVGRITLSGIVRGPLQSGNLGYWVSQTENRRGVATAAVGLMVRTAFADLRLHRVQAETMVHNHASQRVLERNGFVRYGLAPAYLKIAGRWQDHVMFQVINSDGDDTAG
jgi:ribosomal-protein-alanine N-acetyltransferase